MKDLTRLCDGVLSGQPLKASLPVEFSPGGLDSCIFSSPVLHLMDCTDIFTDRQTDRHRHTHTHARTLRLPLCHLNLVTLCNLYIYI